MQIELTVLGLAIIVFLISALVISQAAKTLSSPLSRLAKQLEDQDSDDFSQLSDDSQALEIAQTIDAINSYRQRIQAQIKREQDFTQYISHELRSPMMVIQGANTIVKRQHPELEKQTARISTALESMQNLTHTFLLLARDNISDKAITRVDDAFCQRLLEQNSASAANQSVKLHNQIERPFSLYSEPLLLEVAINNLIQNAIAHSQAGTVKLIVSQSRIDVIDNGCGLGDKPNNAPEGYGIGLQLVRDICQKYAWQFELEEIPQGSGCQASIIFNAKTSAS